MKTKSVYHLGLSKKDIESAKFVFLPGDPARVEKIAKSFDSQSKFLIQKREYCSYLGKINNVPILVTSTGIGGASTSIAVDELSQLGIKTFLRVGTTGAISPKIEIGDVIITTGSVRLDGVSNHYAPIEYPAVSCYEVIDALVKSSIKSKIKFHVGITASSATFYPGQERYDSYSKYVIRNFQGSNLEWEKLNVLNYEMESATLLTMASAFGLKAGCITGVVNKRVKSEKITKKHLEMGEKNVIEVAIEAMKILIKN
ncbi:MAG: uridine phosphorylase [bacterium]